MTAAAGLDLPQAAPSTRRGRVSWALFDWAQQPYFMMVVGFIFGPWFAAEFFGDPVRGQATYGFAIAMTGLGIALLSPLIGAISGPSIARGSHPENGNCADLPAAAKMNSKPTSVAAAPRREFASMFQRPSNSAWAESAPAKWCSKNTPTSNPISAIL